MNWHSLPRDEVLKRLATQESGLTQREAEKRLIRFGPNRIAEEKKKTPLRLFLEQFNNFLIIILIIATFLSLFIGEVTEGIVILAIVIMAAFFSFIQNYRAEQVMRELKKMAPEYARVLRDGEEKTILSESLVPGDIIFLSPGDKVPADCYLLEEVFLKVDEGVLTGESVPVEKELCLLPETTPLSERKNNLFSGTVVVYGRGKAVVVGTGMNTEFGKIAASLEAIQETKTPLQISIDKLGKWLGLLTIIVCALIAGIGISRGEKILKMLIWAVALAVAVVPEALPAVITVCLSLGIRRMAKRNALVRRLSSVETLGATNVICTDKTGTITKGEMSVERIFLAKGEREITVTGVGYEPKGDFFLQHGPEDGWLKDLEPLLLIGVLCNDSHLKKEGERWVINGDPTEGALLVLAAKRGIKKEQMSAKYKRVKEIPFSPERRLMTTVHANGEKFLIATKGAGEVVLSKCSLTEGRRQELLGRLRDMAGKGLRVLGIAYREIDEGLVGEKIEEDLTFLGFVGMMDLPREGVKEAVQKCREAGIKTIMITGDHLLTAKACAHKTGILERGLAIEGCELDRLSDAELQDVIDEIAVIARSSSFHKLRVVEALQKKGNIVAMTGDGVNDAPALKKADIGVAMGITGTSVSKEVSDLILLDDNFVTIVSAIEEGRNIFKNTKNFLGYGLGLHLGEILIMVLSLVFGLPLPLIASQILWINLVTDGLPPMALSIEPPEPGMMKRPPRGKKETFFSRRVIGLGILIGLLMTIQAFVLFKYGLSTSEEKGRTMTFAMITISAMFNVFNWRSERISVFRLPFFQNRHLLLAVISTVLLLLAVIYLPILQKSFSTVPLLPGDWLKILGLGLTTVLAVELIKLLPNFLPRTAR